jgi:ketosteroid isomerase-like protein
MAQIPAFLAALEAAFNEAMVSNDAERIATCVTPEWLLVTPENGPVPCARILEVIRSGQLTHASMSKEPLAGEQAGDLAWVTGRGRNTGTWHGAPFEADEWVTDVYRRQGDGAWRCVLTHLTSARR